MQKHLLVVVSFIITVLCWGICRPLLQWGQHSMASESGDAILRPFVIIGVAALVIGVLVPIVLLRLKGEEGRWSMTGIVRSLAAGAAGAFGTLGLMLTFHFGGRPFYVLPLVFGGALVVNSFLSIMFAGIKKQINWVFGAGLVMLILGVVLLVCQPGAKRAEGDVEFHFVWLILCIALTIVCWGAFGPILQRGQSAMQPSRLRPLLCIGLAYSATAFVVPHLLMLTGFQENSSYTLLGTTWSLLAGAAGAVGAFGVILAFTLGGKPLFVVPLVLGWTAVFDRFWVIVAADKTGGAGTLFTTGSVLILAGSAMVLIFAPRGRPAAKTPPKKEPPKTPKKETEANNRPRTAEKEGGT